MEQSQPHIPKSPFAQLMAPPHRDIDPLPAPPSLSPGPNTRDLDIPTYLRTLKRFGLRVQSRIADSSPEASIQALNSVLFEEENFRGNEDEYYDPRNSFLNEVIDRRIGIPITLCLVYMEVARHAGIEIKGVSFPRPLPSSSTRPRKAPFS